MTRTAGRGLICLGAALALLCSAAGVGAADDEDEGRRLFQRGQGSLEAGDYRAAARAFEAGYAAAPRVGFLLNIGNCYRKLGELGKARQFYWRFLDAAPRRHPSRTEVMEYLRSMEQIEADGVAVDVAPEPPAGHSAPVAVKPAGPAPPRSSGVAIAPLPVTAAPVTAPVRPAPPVLAASPSPPPVAGELARRRLVAEGAGNTSGVPGKTASAPMWHRWWFWSVVGGLVAGGVGAVAIGRSASRSCAASLGCARE
jgi:hypothetical protein